MVCPGENRVSLNSPQYCLNSQCFWNKDSISLFDMFNNNLYHSVVPGDLSQEWGLFF